MQGTHRVPLWLRGCNTTFKCGKKEIYRQEKDQPLKKTNMIKEKSTQKNKKPHTEAKLKFYIHYIERYLPILLKASYINEIFISFLVL